MVYETKFNIGDEIFVQDGRKIFKTKIKSILILPDDGINFRVRYHLVSEDHELYGVHPFSESRLMTEEEAKVQFERITLETFTELFGK